MAMQYWKTLHSDEGAHFDRIVTLDAAKLPPIVTWGSSPEDVAAVTGVLLGRGEHRGAATVDIPGGTVRVTVDPDGSTLSGPAVFVARGELDQVWWNSFGE